MDQINKQIENIKNSDMSDGEKRKHISEWKWELRKEKILKSNLTAVIISIIASVITNLVLMLIGIL